MDGSNLSGVESIRIVRADGNLQIGATEGGAAIECNVEPAIHRDGGTAEISVRSNAAVAVPPGVTVEVIDCAGNLDAEDLSTPLAIGRVGGNFRARRMGAISVREKISGNTTMRKIGALEAERISGSLSIDGARSLSVASVAGSLDARAIQGDATVAHVGGHALLHDVAGAVRLRHVGGKLYAEAVGELDAEMVGGKTRASGVTRAVRLAHVGGRLTVEGIGGDVSVESVGGHAIVARAAGAVELAQVGGAVHLRGPFPAAKSWKVRSRGRALLELDNESSLNLTASAQRGHIRLFGVDDAGVRWAGRDRVEGAIGAERADAERTGVTIETAHADIIIARAGAREREFCGGGFRQGRPFPGAFSELGDIIAEEFGDEVPRFVSSILGAVGQFAARTGSWSGAVVRDVTQDVARGVREGLADVESTLEDIEEKVPQEVAQRLAELGQRIDELVRRAAADGRLRSREARREMREKIRTAAREMRETIREAAREARERSQTAPERPAGEPGASARPRPPQGATRPLTPEASAGDMMSILRAVKEGRLDPEEADEMIAALMEVEREAVGRRGEPR